MLPVVMNTRCHLPTFAPRFLVLGVVIAAVVLVVLVGGCKPYRVEYHKHSKFYDQAVRGGMPRKVVLDDGTVIYNLVGESRSDLQRISEDKEDPFKIREEHDDGSVTLQAVLPMHVLQNAYTCLTNEEYDVVWDQLLSERTKLAYEEQGQGEEEFAAFWQQHRQELGRTLNRMILELPRQGVVTDNLGHGVIQMRFHPVLARQMQFKFTTVQVISEGLGLKLLMVK